MAVSISASEVKKLRDKTSAGMMECKKALQEAKGDFESAVKLLREKGIAKSAKRAGRTAAEGLVSASANTQSSAAALVELNCETDFVARNPDFQKMVLALSMAALDKKTDSVEALLPVTLPEYGKSAEEALKDMLAVIGEKIEINRVAYAEADAVASYIHPPGKIGVLVPARIEAGADRAKAMDLLRDIAMHIAAFNPRFLTEDEVDQKTLDEEREVYANKARKEGKPENIIDRIVEGQIKSFYKENCLLLQPFAKDTSMTVGQLIEKARTELGGKVNLEKFIRFQLGEASEGGAESE